MVRWWILHPTKADIRAWVEASPITEEAALLVRQLRDPYCSAHVAREIAAEFIEREYLTDHKRGRPRKDAAPYSYGDAHIDVMKRMVFRRVVRVRDVLRRQGRTPPKKLLAAALRRVANETGLHERTVRRHYKFGLK